MSEPTATRSLVLERVLPHPPQKVWRALTEAPLLDEWLMHSDFKPEVGHRFTFRAPPAPGWNGITDCEVLAVEPHQRLAYHWNSSGEEAANGLKSVVTWTLSPFEGGTLLRMEQSGFKPAQTYAYEGANFGWSRFLAGLEEVLGKIT